MTTTRRKTQQLSQSPSPDPKRRKITAPSKKNNGTSSLHERILNSSPSTHTAPAHPPQRRHTPGYHRPLLLSSPEGRQALLKWFDSVSTTRRMPWRKAWIDPASHASDGDELRDLLERRAYQVWISEIMLQQTRVAVVIDYWNRWMEKWPTIHDLAAATPEEVLSAWRGLGYYSRATRIHEAAKLMVADEEAKGLLPADVIQLEKKVPGVGRYTAGAISAIVFGRAAPMVDGNVLRVLSRQLGVLGNVKTDKTVIDFLWAAADALVKSVARDDGDDESGAAPEVEAPPISDRPGRWGQALMELGSTVCTPKPNCAQCPITTTCRAYAEGQSLVSQSRPAGQSADIEDACTICEPLEEADSAEGNDTPGSPEVPCKDTKAKAGGKQTTLAAFRFTRSTKDKKPIPQPDNKPDTKQMETIVEHARKFPLKVIKKAVRQEETVACAMQMPDGRYLIHQRPKKGLLAGMWEFPSKPLPEEGQGDTKSSAAVRKRLAKQHAAEVLGSKKPGVIHVGELGSVPWVFSHLKLTMHVHLFEIEDDGATALPGDDATKRWATGNEIEQESMGTGMRHCWALVQKASG